MFVQKEGKKIQINKANYVKILSRLLATTNKKNKFKKIIKKHAKNKRKFNKQNILKYATDNMQYNNEGSGFCRETC